MTKTRNDAVTVVFDVDDDLRRLMRRRHGRRGKASASEVESEIRMIVAAMFEDYRHDGERDGKD